MLLYFTPIGIMHQNFNQIESTTMEVSFSPISRVLLACCLLLACLLLAAAKPGRSTLDTKKGYKTKTGSTSSVTLTLTLALTLTVTLTLTLALPLALALTLDSGYS